MTSPITALNRRLALAALLPLASIAGAQAGPATGGGQPISDLQPSLGLEYIVRTSDPGNFADVGQVALFAGGFAPAGWALANGQQVSIATNPVLFSQIGATYGGNGTTTFDLPNLNGRVAIGSGQGAGLANQPPGTVSGANSQILTAGELPPFGGASGVTAGGAPVPIRQPSLALNYGIVTQGAFPPRDGSPVQGPFIGQIVSYAGPTAPAGVLPANGRPLPINQYTALFSILGTNYGGNGITTFDLPDLQGRAPTEAGQAPGLAGVTLGEKTGAEQVLLTTAQLPPNQLTLPNGGTRVIGGGQPFSIAQPSLGLHAIIDINGAFPTRENQITGTTPFLGEITWFAGTFAPAGWAFADGQLLSIAQDPALFSIIGTFYGGNGITTFALPDLEDRVAVAVGAGGAFALGERFGSGTDTLAYAQLPVGYPPSVPVTNTVPEPPGAMLVAIGICGLLLGRRHGRAGR